MEERRMNQQDRLGQLEAFAAEARETLKTMSAELEKNTHLTEDIRELLVLGKSFFTIMKYVGIAAKWITIVSAAAFAVFHFGPPPK